jgi:hypothetical protein
MAGPKVSKVLLRSVRDFARHPAGSPSPSTPPRSARSPQDGDTTRKAAYDLRKLRGKQLISQPGRTRRYHVPADSARIIAALFALCEHVIAPIPAGSAALAWAGTAMPARDGSAAAPVRT